jgi:putative salt-induced outer membrane protein YdiY
MTARLVLFSALVISVTIVSGDEILFKSGDRLTGTVKSVDGGKMVFDSAVAGPVTLKMDSIKTFSTEKAIEIVQTNGTVVVQRVGMGADGQVIVLADAAQPQTVPFTEIAKINPGKSKWTGSIVAGAALTRGNTESSTANINADATRRGERDRIYLAAGYLFANQRDNNTGQNSTSADTWFLKGKYDYFFTQRFFGYANMKYEKDRIANLDMRLSPGAGAGYQWVENARVNFFTEAGLTYVREVYTNPDETRSYVAARGAYHLNFVVNDHVKGFHNFEVIPNIEDVQAVLVYTDVGLRAAMTERLFLEGKAQLAFNSQPADNREKKDMRYTLGIGWTF